MGLFSKKKKPDITVPTPPKYPTAEELYAQAIAFAKANMPLAYGAREGALSDLAQGQEYYKGWQPTSFEEALGAQNFANIMPDIERSIKQNLSMSGMAYSPILSEQIAEQRGKLGVSIGEILSNLANQRAQYSLTSRMGIDPYTTTSPYADVAQFQGNKIADVDYAYRVLLQNAENERAARAAQAKAAQGKLGGAGIGAAIAALLAIPTGGMSLAALPGMMSAAGTGANIGGNVASMFSGGTPDIGSLFSSMSSLGKPQAVNASSNVYGNVSKMPSGGDVSSGRYPWDEQYSLPNSGGGFDISSILKMFGQG